MSGVLLGLSHLTGCSQSATVLHLLLQCPYTLPIQLNDISLTWRLR